MKSLFLVLSLASAPAFAESLTCTLESGDESQSMEIKLPKKTGDIDYVIMDKRVYDLSVNINGSCDKKECGMSLTVDSVVIEDEVAQDSFTFKRDGVRKKVYDEALENAPDGRAYTFVCTYRPK